VSGHVGIVACSAEGAALCYRTICLEGPARLGPHGHPEISLHSASLASYVACLERNDLAGVATLMLASADRLAAAGADFLICPDNTIHAALPLVLPRSPLPWLHIAEVVADAARARGLRHLGILGTRWLVQSEVYPDVLRQRGLGLQRPSLAGIAAVDRIIMEELVRGQRRPESTARLLGEIGVLAAAGCDGVVLGCTELPLVLDDANSPLPTLDSTRLLARAALVRSLEASRA
jgi:aspartate racemase